jgi:hypothetical protein
VSARGETKRERDTTYRGDDRRGLACKNRLAPLDHTRLNVTGRLLAFASLGSVLGVVLGAHFQAGAVGGGESGSFQAKVVGLESGSNFAKKGLQPA